MLLEGDEISKSFGGLAKISEHASRQSMRIIRINLHNISVEGTA
jgi:hypothetical protein